MFALTPIVRRKGFLSRPSRDFFDRFFGDFTLPSLMFEEAEWTPAFDVSETDGELIVKAEVPGMDKKDINITVSDGMLTIKGEKKAETEVNEEDYHLRECSYGSFHRSISLPPNVNPQKIEASFDDGVLEVTLPKAAEVKAKKVSVSAKKKEKAKSPTKKTTSARKKTGTGSK